MDAPRVRALGTINTPITGFNCVEQFPVLCAVGEAPQGRTGSGPWLPAWGSPAPPWLSGTEASSSCGKAQGPLQCRARPWPPRSALPGLLAVFLRHPLLKFGCNGIKKKKKNLYFFQGGEAVAPTVIPLPTLSVLVWGNTKVQLQLWSD